jgi:pimeloyl-ACP methyl ester carboxylesterase
MKTCELSANGMSYRIRELGDGEPVLLLHGFPETSAMWEGLMGSLAEAGYHCVAPDQRGYSPGARPAGIDAYRYEDVGADVFGFAEALGWERFHLIGHDWGAGAGWCALAIDEGPIASWTAMSVGHYRPFAEAVRDDPEEETYRGFLNGINDDLAAVMSADDCALMKGIWVGPPEEIDDYVSVFRDPAALDAALNWYRASRLHMRFFDGDSLEFGPVSAPTLFLWGRNDPYIRPRSVDGAAGYMKGPYRRVDLDAGHWLIQERPDECRTEILSHLRENAL